MKLRFLCSGLLLVGFMSNAAFAELTYNQDFESLDPNNATALSGDGWLIGNINITDGGQWFGPGNQAPNNTADGLNGYSALVTGQGGPSQGNNQLSVFSDYNPWSSFGNPGNQTLDTFLYRDLGTITADMVGKDYIFSYDAKENGIENEAASEAYAYINVLKQSDSSFISLGNPELSTEVGTNWGGGGVTISIDAGMVGELLQIGFRNRTTEWAASAVAYDNLGFASSIPEPGSFAALAVGCIGVVARRRRR